MDSILNSYLDTINKIPRLTRAEEVELGTIISTSEDEENINTAVNKLVESNLKLVVHYARKRQRDNVVSMMDVINAGNLGLLMAAKKYDPVKYGEASFGTYAKHSIQKYINKLLYEQFITTPAGLIYNQYKISQLKLKYGDDIDEKFIQEELGVKDSEFNNIKMSYTTRHSLDAPVNEDSDDNCSVMEIFPDETPQKLFDKIEIDDEHRHILGIMDDCLTDIEKDIVFSMILSDEPKTLNEMGARYNYTGENIRRKKQTALNKIKDRLKEQKVFNLC